MLSVVLKFSSLCLIVYSAVFFSFYVYNSFSYWKKRNVPYIRPYFPFGNLGFFMRRSFWEFCLELKTKHPNDYVGIYLGLKPALLVQTPELARKILMKDFECFETRSMYVNESDSLGSMSLLTLKSPMWSEMREKLTPLFTTVRIKNVTALMNHNATELVKKVQRDFINNGNSVNLMELFIMFTTDNIAYSIFGIRSSILTGEASPLWAITQHMVTWNFRRGLEFSLIFLFPSVAAFFRLNLFSEVGSKYIENMFWNVVKERQLTRKTNDQDLVNHLLKLKENLKLPSSAGPELANQLMVAQTASFIMASIEGPATTMTFCLHELAYHHDIQEKLYDEVSEALKSTGKDILQYEDLVELKYLTACIYETLRKYPVISVLDRMCNKTCKLNDEFTIEKGVPVFVNILAIHYDEKYYPSPTEWRPERFLDAHDKDQYTFLTFGGGPRACLGQRFGIMQIRTAIAQLITKYKFEPAAPYNVPLHPFSIPISPKRGGVVKFVRR